MYDKHEANVRKARERSIRNNRAKHKSPSKIRRLERRRLEREAASTKVQPISGNSKPLATGAAEPSLKDLKAWATEASLPGRSKMNKDQLLVAWKASR